MIFRHVPASDNLDALLVKARTDGEVRMRETASHDRELRLIGECFELNKKSADQKATCDRLVERLAPQAK